MLGRVKNVKVAVTKQTASATSVVRALPAHLGSDATALQQGGVSAAQLASSKPRKAVGTKSVSCVKAAWLDMRRCLAAGAAAAAPARRVRTGSSRVPAKTARGTRDARLAKGAAPAGTA